MSLLGKWKIIDSNIPLKGDMLVPRKGIFQLICGQLQILKLNVSAILHRIPLLFTTFCGDQLAEKVTKKYCLFIFPFSYVWSNGILVGGFNPFERY